MPSKQQQYEAPDGTVVEIPAGAEIEYTDGGDIRIWRMPAEYTGQKLHPDQVKDYAPKVDRGSVHRRVLQQITDEVDSHRFGPRNTVASLAASLSVDPNTPQIDAPSVTYMRALSGGKINFGGGETAEAQVEQVLTELVAKGLATQRDDGSYQLTAEGLRELKT